MFNLESVNSEKMHSDDRILVLEVIDGKKALSSTGTVDSRLFKGGNQLHAIRDPNDGLWFLRYEAGGLQEPLKQKWTRFSALLNFCRDYFEKRNLNIKEVKS